MSTARIDLTLRPPISQDHFSFKSMFQMEHFLISHLLEGAEEAFQLLHNISQLEQYGFLLSSGFHSSDGKARTLQDIYMFVKSEIQQNPSLSAKELCVRYFAHDKQFRGLVKSFQVLNQCVRSFPSLI